MANVNTTVEQLSECGLTSKNGYKIGKLASTTKAAQNDTVTIKNASSVAQAIIAIVATGASETNTVSTNVITCTSATTGAVSGLVIYR